LTRAGLERISSWLQGVGVPASKVGWNGWKECATLLGLESDPSSAKIVRQAYMASLCTESDAKSDTSDDTSDDDRDDAGVDDGDSIHTEGDENMMSAANRKEPEEKDAKKGHPPSKKRERPPLTRKQSEETVVCDGVAHDDTSKQQASVPLELSNKRIQEEAVNEVKASPQKIQRTSEPSQVEGVECTSVQETVDESLASVASTGSTGLNQSAETSSTVKPGVVRVKDEDGVKIWYFQHEGLNDGKVTRLTDDYMRRYHGDMILKYYDL